MDIYQELHFYFDFSMPESLTLWEPLLSYCEGKPIHIYAYPISRSLLSGYVEREFAESPSFHSLQRLIRNAESRLALQVAQIEISGSIQFVVVECLLQYCWYKGLKIIRAEAIVQALDAIGLDGYDLVKKASEQDAWQWVVRQTEEASFRGVNALPAININGSVLNGMGAVLNHFPSLIEPKLSLVVD